MKYTRMPIEKESPEQFGYEKIKNNLTETSVRDRNIRDLGMVLDDILLPYGDHLGDPRLRRLIAEQSGITDPDCVIVTGGAASALFLVASSLLEPGDHMIVARPNYGTNIATPEAIGADISYLDQKFEEGFRVDIEKLESLIRPDTKYISLTNPHNPTGTMMGLRELKRVIAIAEKHGVRLLVDETYRDMFKDERLPVAASLSKKVISISSLSKTYGIPGIRIGWAVCQDKEMIELLTCAKEQVCIGGSVVDEYIGYVALSQKKEWIAENDALIAGRFAIVKEWVANEEFIEWVEPRAACTCFPRIKESAGVDVEKFYKIMNDKYGTYIGPGHWFGFDDRYMRIGYAWPLEDELRAGLAGISAAIREARK
ncbi:aminotransferase class I/II-fold pyridoxal phosphate-dependent enzyme [Cloacibacillus evryensis]|uniref:aminotransferase class I/II-fold pyridoxal phosphate-dependent enzyme n=1 Tax=Cloacibacillus evryensis TaxID=508460 RepID=UPI00241F43FF|nr:aminotransferase class I/II-fold pyridoxal phosphate-dependent enzyme [Cloacibacillus evryensis]